MREAWIPELEAASGELIGACKLVETTPAAPAQPRWHKSRASVNCVGVSRHLRRARTPSPSRNAARTASTAILGTQLSGKKRDRLQGLLSCPLFKRLDPAAQNRLLSAGKEQEFAPGDLLVRQGDQAGSMFFIDGGRCSAVQDGKDIDKLGMGDCFGCMAIIQTEIIVQGYGLASSCLLAVDDAPRRCLSVRADTPVLAWELDVDTAIAIFTADANTWAYFYEVATSNGRTLLPLKPHPSHDELIPRSPGVPDAAGQIGESQRGPGQLRRQPPQFRQGQPRSDASPSCAAEDAPSSPSSGAKAANSAKPWASASPHESAATERLMSKLVPPSLALASMLSAQCPGQFVLGGLIHEHGGLIHEHLRAPPSDMIAETLARS